ncbi:RBPJ-interacting and tubulin-associated protein 1 isoform 2-T3 [Thomomys bottae]
MVRAAPALRGGCLRAARGAPRSLGAPGAWPRAPRCQGHPQTSSRGLEPQMRPGLRLHIPGPRRESEAAPWKVAADAFRARDAQPGRPVPRLRFRAVKPRIGDLRDAWTPSSVLGCGEDYRRRCF